MNLCWSEPCLFPRCPAAVTGTAASTWAAWWSAGGRNQRMTECGVSLKTQPPVRIISWTHMHPHRGSSTCWPSSPPWEDSSSGTTPGWCLGPCCSWRRRWTWAPSGRRCWFPAPWGPQQCPPCVVAPWTAGWGARFASWCPVSSSPSAASSWAWPQTRWSCSWAESLWVWA